MQQTVTQHNMHKLETQCNKQKPKPKKQAKAKKPNERNPNFKT